MSTSTSRDLPAFEHKLNKTSFRGSWGGHLMCVHVGYRITPKEGETDSHSVKIGTTIRTKTSSILKSITSPHLTLTGQKMWGQHRRGVDLKALDLKALAHPTSITSSFERPPGLPSPWVTVVSLTINQVGTSWVKGHGWQTWQGAEMRLLHGPWSLLQALERPQQGTLPAPTATEENVACEGSREWTVSLLAEIPLRVALWASPPLW